MLFYHSKIYRLVSEGVSDLHCMSDEYLAEELVDEEGVSDLHCMSDEYLAEELVDEYKEK